MAQTAERDDEFGGKAPFPASLRLAAEPVEGVTEPEGASDAYGLRAELEAQRRRGGPVEQAEPTDGRDPTAETGSHLPEAVDEVAVPEPEPAEHAVAQIDAGEPPPAPVDETARGRGPNFVEEARTRLEALERSLVEKTETLRQRAAEIADREEALTEKLESLDELEAAAGGRQQALEAREAELVAKLAELEAEAERLEEEQAIWGEATKESKTRLAEREAELEGKLRELDERERGLADAEAALAAKTADLEAALSAGTAELEDAHAARLAELEGARAGVDERQAALAREEDEFRSREQVLLEREQELGARDAAIAESEALLEGRQAELAAREQAASEHALTLDTHERDLATRESELASRERSLAGRDADLTSREKALADEAERLDRERGDWDGLIHGAFDRLSELETDLVSSLSLAGMLKRELEGRDSGAERKPGRPEPAVPVTTPPSPIDELAESRSFFRDNGTSEQPVQIATTTVAAEDPAQKAAANDWWARQLGRRKKD